MIRLLHNGLMMGMALAFLIAFLQIEFQNLLYVWEPIKAIRWFEISLFAFAFIFGVWVFVRDARK